VSLRHQQAVVTRDQGATGKPDTVSENKTDKPQE
jgi:hypothetical protein